MKKLTITFLYVLIGCSFSAYGQVDYTEQIQPIFSQNCTSCHGSNSGVSLINYDAVMSSVGDQYETEIVNPGNPDDSPLVDKIEANPEFGSRMPQGGPYLSNEEINLIRTWISEGANETPVSNEIIPEIARGFKMTGNYPNPFNPQTVVTFSSPVKANYNLDIYNAAGMLVEEISGITNTPQTQINVRLNNLPSGIYFYRVKINVSNSAFFLETQKMLLAK